MTFYEQMVSHFLLCWKKDETLNAPIYGTLLQKRDHSFGYFGLTENALLVSLGYIYSISANYLHVNIRILFFQEHVGYEYFLKPHQHKWPIILIL